MYNWCRSSGQSSNSSWFWVTLGGTFNVVEGTFVGCSHEFVSTSAGMSYLFLRWRETIGSLQYLQIIADDFKFR